MIGKALRPGQTGAAALFAMAVALGACAHAEQPPAATAGGASTAPATEIAFDDWLRDFKTEATAAGVSRGVVDREFADVAMVQRVFELNDNQPEFSRAVWDYVDGAVSETRVANGKANYAANEALLADIVKRYGVDPHVIVAIWGLESSYGAIMGDYDALSALATLGWKGRRTAYGRAQVIGALKIIESGFATRSMLKGSWAGAMGQTQFIPTTYLNFAVDFDGDGRRDIWTNLGDVFASTANYLASSGARDGEPWGFEVVLPQPFDYAIADVDVKKPLAEWASLNVKAVGGDLLNAGRDPNLTGRLLLPAGANGPAFLVFANFEAVLKYNNSTAYGLAVGLLSDALADRGRPIAAAWPRGDRPLTLAERKQLQQALKDQGFDPGPVDGVLGAATRRALRAWQQSRGLPADAYASAATLALLLAGSEPAAAPAPAGSTPSSG